MMPVLLLSIAVIVPLVIGKLLVSTCWPDPNPSFHAFWYQWGLAVGIGFGISSLTAFGMLLVVGSTNFTATVGSELVVLWVLLRIRSARQKSVTFPTPLIVTQESSTRLSQIVSIAFYAALVFAIGIFLLRTIENPHGEPDAWTFWNSRARLFFRGGAQWKEIFSKGNWSFPAYPLLIPTNVVRLWSALGRETLIGPAIIAFLFTFATIGMLISALAMLRGRTQGLIGGLILSSTPYFIKHGASQYADVPLGFYILSMLVLINLYDDRPEPVAGLFWLTGITVGFAAWTKEEGFLLLVSVIVARLLTFLVFRGKGMHVGRETWSFFAGIVPMLLFMGYFRIFIAPHQNPTSAQDIQQILAKLTDFARYLQTGKAFLRQLVEPYSLVYSTPIAIFGVYVIFLGLKWTQFKKPGVITSLLIVGLMFCGYFLIYITTSTDVAWLLDTTLSRLFLQLWPGLIFVFLMLISNPEEQGRENCSTLSF